MEALPIQGASVVGLEPGFMGRSGRLVQTVVCGSVGFAVLQFGPSGVPAMMLLQGSQLFQISGFLRVVSLAYLPGHTCSGAPCNPRAINRPMGA